MDYNVLESTCSEKTIVTNMEITFQLPRLHSKSKHVLITDNLYIFENNFFRTRSQLGQRKQYNE